MPEATMNSGIWTEEEHERFLQAMELFESWPHVARHVGTRSPIQCRSHNQKLEKKVRKAKQRGDFRAPRREHRVPRIDELTTGVQAMEMTVKQVASPPAHPPPISPSGADEPIAITEWFHRLDDDTQQMLENFDFDDTSNTCDLDGFEDLNDEQLNTDLGLAIE